MNRIRFFTDEDIYGSVALRLRTGGFDAISTPEAGRLGEDDPSQLSWAAPEGRVLITFNVADFARLHQEWIVRGDNHSGIVISHQRPIGELIRRLLNLGQNLTASEMRERLEYLSNWPPL
jgi:hypothetical protein